MANPPSVRPATFGEQDTTDHLTVGDLAAAIPAFSYASATAAGVLDTFVRSDATLDIFDDQTPANLAAIADTGTAAFASRRDHVHLTPPALYIQAFIANGDTVTVPTKNQIVVCEEYAVEGSGELVLEGTSQLCVLGIA